MSQSQIKVKLSQGLDPGREGARGREREGRRGRERGREGEGGRGREGERAGQYLKMGEKADGLDGFPQTHLIAQDHGHAVREHVSHPTDTLEGREILYIGGGVGITSD